MVLIRTGSLCEHYFIFEIKYTVIIQRLELWRLRMSNTFIPGPDSGLNPLTFANVCSALDTYLPIGKAL